MLPKKGRKLHPWNGLARSAKVYAELIADALHREHDNTHRTVKTIMRWTGASERSVKNWLSGEAGPSGYFLMRLCVKSIAVRALVLELFTEAAGAVDPGDGSENGSVAMSTTRSGTTESPVQSGRFDSINGDTNSDIIGDMNVTNNPTLNARQEWLLARVAQGARCTYEDIAVHWQVSSRTAKRDIASLKDSGLIRYLGRHRRGFYVAGQH